jgi:phosphonate transport system substrate-binding protein
LLRALLTEQYKVSYSANYVQTHSNAYRHVARGESLAAGGIRSTFEREPEELRSKLRVL